MRLPLEGHWSALNAFNDGWKLVDESAETMAFMVCEPEHACVGAETRRNFTGYLQRDDPRVYVLPQNSSIAGSSPLSGKGIRPGDWLSVGSAIVRVHPAAVIDCESIPVETSCKRYECKAPLCNTSLCRWNPDETFCETAIDLDSSTSYVYMTHFIIPLEEYDGGYIDAAPIVVLPRGTDELAYQNCSKGYTGFRCGVCEWGYFRSSDECMQCPENLALSWLYLLIGVLVLLGYIAFMIITAVTTARDHADSFSVSLKILLGWFQMTSVALSFKVKWPQALVTFLQTQNTVSGYTSQALVSVDCVIQSFTSPGTVIPLYTALTFILLPIIFVLVAILVWGSVYLCQRVCVRRRLDEHWHYLISLAKARDKLLFQMMQVAKAKAKKETTPNIEEHLEAKLTFERMEFTHLMLEKLELGFQEHQISDLEHQLLADAKLRPGSVTLKGGKYIKKLNSLAAINADPKLEQKMKVKRFTTKVESDIDPTTKLIGPSVGGGAEGPPSRALAAVARRQNMVLRMITRMRSISGEDSPGLEKLAQHIRTYVS